MSLEPEHETYVSRAQCRALKQRQYVIDELPPAGEPFRWSDLDITDADLYKLSEVDIIEKRDQIDGSTSAHYWSTVPGIHEWAADHIDESARTPCGKATGVRNLGDGEFTCNNSDCDCRMTREQAREVLA